MAKAPKAYRSAVTNGARTFVMGDGRGPWARRFKDLIALHVEEALPSSILLRADEVVE